MTLPLLQICLPHSLIERVHIIQLTAVMFCLKNFLDKYDDYTGAADYSYHISVETVDKLTSAYAL